MKNKSLLIGAIIIGIIIYAMSGKKDSVKPGSTSVPGTSTGPDAGMGGIGYRSV
jgi:hypothetical protein